VNKADLFFDKNEFDATQTYYHSKGNSEFSKAIREFIQQFDRQRLNPS